jgi:uncharacterized coiled-coil protein SlyX
MNNLNPEWAKTHVRLSELETYMDFCSHKIDTLNDVWHKVIDQTSVDHWQGQWSRLYKEYRTLQDTLLEGEEVST